MTPNGTTPNLVCSRPHLAENGPMRTKPIHMRRKWVGGSTPRLGQTQKVYEQSKLWLTPPPRTNGNGRVDRLIWTKAARLVRAGWPHRDPVGRSGSRAVGRGRANRRKAGVGRAGGRTSGRAVDLSLAVGRDVGWAVARGGPQLHQQLARPTPESTRAMRGGARNQNPPCPRTRARLALHYSFPTKPSLRRAEVAFARHYVWQWPGAEAGSSSKG